MEIEVKKGSLLEVEAQVIVNPANSQGVMGGGVAGVIKKVGGKQIEDEARARAPIPVGEAVMTTGGNTRFQGVIHAPTMERPAMRIPLENVRKATIAALEEADRQAIEVLAIPGMGTGVGGVRKEEAAQVMVEAIKGFSPRALKKVVLVDIDEQMVSAWQKALEAKK